MRKLVNHVAMCLGVFVFALCASVSSAQPPDPIVGTWKLNLGKSKYPAPAPKSMTLTVAPAAKGWAITVDAVGSDGQAQKWGYTSTFDGSESSVSGNATIDAGGGHEIAIRLVATFCLFRSQRRYRRDARGAECGHAGRRQRGDAERGGGAQQRDRVRGADAKQQSFDQSRSGRGAS